MNRRATETLAGFLIGRVPPAGASFVKGLFSGVAAFLLFELVSRFNDNVPRVPVSWMMMAATFAIETVLLFRLIRLIRFPRRADLFFLLRIPYDRRIAVALYASKQAHAAFIPFSVAALAVAALLEFTLIHERSVMTLVAVPVFTMMVMAGTAAICRFALRHRWIPVTRRDNGGDSAGATKSTFFSRILAKTAVPFTRAVSGWLPGRGIRVLVMRNLLYILRGETVLSVLIMTAVPVLLTVLLLMIGNPFSPFVSFLPLLAVFMMNQHFITELGEAAENLTLCHWYSYAPRTLLLSNGCTLIIPSLSIMAVYAAVTVHTLFSVAGSIRFLNVAVSFLATVAIAAFRAASVKKQDQDVMNDFLLFAVIAVGNFIPRVGGVFALVVMGLLLLLNWEMIGSGTGKHTPASPMPKSS